MRLNVPEMKHVEISAEIASNPQLVERVTLASSVMPEVWGEHAKDYSADWELKSPAPNTSRLFLSVRDGDRSASVLLEPSEIEDSLYWRRRLLRLQSRLLELESQEHLDKLGRILASSSMNEE